MIFAGAAVVRRPRATRSMSRAFFPLLISCLGLTGTTGCAYAQANDESSISQRPPSLWTEELTSPEIGAAIGAGFTSVIVPTGGVEENGPYLATGKHNLILEALCPAIAERLGDALCAPIVKFVPEGDIDPPTGLMRYPGTISVRQSTYVELLDDIISSLKQAGFSDLILIGDSGGNQRGLETVAARLNERWGRDARVHYISAFYSPGWEAVEHYTQEELGVSETTHDGFHDDIWVTAMMAVTDPEQIRYAERVAAGTASINGVALSPLDRTLALGQQMIAFRADFTARAIRNALSDAVGQD